MSQANVDLVRQVYDAFARGDVGSVLTAMADDVEFVAAENSLLYRGRPYAGKQDVAENVFGRIGAEWDRFWVDPEKLHDAGDIIVMQGRYRGTYKATGRVTEAQVVHIWTVRDGKLAKLEQYVDTAATRDVAAGSSGGTSA